MKIAIFTDSFVPGIGGTENAVLKFAKELAKENEVIVFAPNYHRFFDESTLQFKIVRARSIVVTKNDCWAMPAITRKIRKTLDEFKPDVLHTETLGMMASYANKYGKKHNIPIICTVHTKYRYCYKSIFKFSFIANIIARFVVKRAKNANKVCTVSNSMIEELKSYGYKGTIEVIRNGYDLKGIPFKEKNTDKIFTMLYVGMIADFKNIKFSLDVLSSLKKRRSDFVFCLVGRGNEKQFKRYAKKIGVADNVVFTGEITDREKLYDIYSNADIMFFTSIFDNDSLVLLEAAEAGTPSLVISGSGSSERFIDNETAFFTEYDKLKTVEKIESLMDNRELIKKVGKNSVNVFFSWREIALQYIEIYKKEIEKKDTCMLKSLQKISINIDELSN